MNRVRELRKQKHITQEELGKVLDIQKAAISKYENGRAEPSTEVLKKMSAYFGVSIDYLLGNSPKPAITVVEKQKDTIPVLDDPDIRILARNSQVTKDPEKRAMLKRVLKTMLEDAEHDK